jgi:hypothetical protein
MQMRPLSALVTSLSRFHRDSLPWCRKNVEFHQLLNGEKLKIYLKPRSLMFHELKLYVSII